MATILTKKKDTTGAPGAGDLTNSTGGAELAVNTADKRLYTKDSGGNVVEIGTAPSTIDINAGTIDGTAIGGSTPAAGSFTALNTSGQVVFNDAGADVDFRVEGDTDANLLFVDASTDRVGIGTNAPGFKLHISGSGTTAKINTLDTHDGGASISTWQKVGRRAGTGTNAYINTVHSGSDAVDALTLAFGTSGTGTETIRFPASGGITFNGDTAAANALDDYEEGTWTPSIGGTATYTNTFGIYTKIGNVVTVQFRIQIVNLGTGSVFRLSGLPFVSVLLGSVQSGHCAYYQSLAVNTIYLAFYVENNATTIQFVGKASSGASVDNGISLFGNDAIVLGQATYRVA